MPLQPEQFQTCIELLIPHIETPEDRQIFVTGALYDSVVPTFLQQYLII
jgi:hypothetical protein